MGDAIRTILAEHGRLFDATRLGEGDDLDPSIRAMPAVEDAYATELPDNLLRASTLQWAMSIRTAVGVLGADGGSKL